jgi:uncharacterized NAD-dependent epimerase/dehydratase family protein
MIQTLQIPRPYLIFIGDIVVPLGVKTGLGIVEWRREWCAGQYRFDASGADLGLPDMTPAQAAAAGVATMVIGGASHGGKMPAAWIDAIGAALDAGLNVAAGLHDRLADIPGLAERARRAGRELYDVRGVPRGMTVPVATGRKRTGLRVLTVGTDCAVGKKFTALALERDLRQRGLAATFRATGQTGLFISGGGLAVDAIVSDFLAGAAELLSPDAPPDHWDVIEGQGSLFHPAYAAVSLGLLHGSQPDAVVLCHEPTRPHMLGYPDYPPPSLEECIAHTLACGRLTNRAIQCVGISLNTSQLPEAQRFDALSAVERETGLPCVDPALTGTGKLVDALVALRTARESRTVRPSE